jgi:hypothetical protein
MITVLAAAAILVQAPTIHLTITTDGKKVGDAWLTQKLEPGGKKTHAKLILGETRIIETAEYAMDGTPKTKVLTQTAMGKDMTVEAVFGTTEVKVTVAGQLSTVALPTKSSLKAKSEFWFLQTKPPVNHSVEYQRFDLNTRKFVPCKVTFLGREEITTGGKKLTANRVKVDGKTDAWLDERGDPYRMVLEGGTRFERIAP